MSKNILITGGSGMLGQRLSEMLTEKGYQVAWLSRSKSGGRYKTYVWDLKKKKVEEEAIRTADVLIHLAGAGVVDKAWTNEYKEVLRASRVEGVRLLSEKIKATPNNIKTIISASAVGYYGEDTKEALKEESDKKGKGFLADLTNQWEVALDESPKEGTRVVKIRIGIILSKKGGALEKMAMPVRYFLGAALGTGQQYLSWIHIDDLCNMFIYAIEKPEMEGVYNGVGPKPTTNQEFTESIAKIVKKPLWLPNVPAFVLKRVFGKERAMVLLGGNRVSSAKIEKEGFVFRFSSLKEALTDLWQ